VDVHAADLVGITGVESCSYTPVSKVYTLEATYCSFDSLPPSQKKVFIMMNYKIERLTKNRNPQRGGILLTAFRYNTKTNLNSVGAVSARLVLIIGHIWLFVLSDLPLFAKYIEVTACTSC
jgi:hypothetical protein